MADETKPKDVITPPAPPKEVAPTPQPSEADFKVAITNVEVVTKEILETYQGKNGYNPFLWVHQNIQPLVDRYNKGERSLALKNELMAIKVVDPKLPAITVARWDMSKQLEIAAKSKKTS
jgi:hypothetical protein